MFAIYSLILRASIGFTIDTSEKDSTTWKVLLCIVPIMRILKMLRQFQTLQILVGAFILSAEALPVLLYMFLVIALASASIIYIVEPRDNIPTPATAAWLTIVTMTAVGYGDITPTTPMGYIVIAILSVLSMLFMAMPLGIIGSAFNMVWSDRDRILLTQRTRKRLTQWGYTADDVMVLFKFMDSDGDGELCIQDFDRLMRHMRLGLNKERVFQLFNTFDQDGSGTVDPEEFVRVFFPTSFIEMFRDMEFAGYSQTHSVHSSQEQGRDRIKRIASTELEEKVSEGRQKRGHANVNPLLSLSPVPSPSISSEGSPTKESDSVSQGKKAWF
jgi:hypothetical protein